MAAADIKNILHEDADNWSVHEQSNVNNTVCGLSMGQTILDIY